MFDEKVSSKDTLPSQTLGLFKHEFGNDGKIKDTWFIRQFSKDEAARKVRMSGLHLQHVKLLFVVSSHLGMAICHTAYHVYIFLLLNANAVHST